MPGKAYLIGNYLGKNPIVAIIITAIIVILLLFSSMETSINISATSKKEELNASGLTKQEQDKLNAQLEKNKASVAIAVIDTACGGAFAKRWADHEKAIRAKNFREAAEALKPCVDATGSPKNFKTAFISADKENLTRLANSKGAKPDERIEAIYSINQKYPDISKPYMQMLGALEKQKKKSEGISLGMTTQDVVDSSWGRPERINRTTGYNVNRQQWVYGNGNYLYFEHDILTSMQTRE